MSLPKSVLKSNHMLAQSIARAFSDLVLQDDDDVCPIDGTEYYDVVGTISAVLNKG